MTLVSNRHPIHLIALWQGLNPATLITFFVATALFTCPGFSNLLQLQRLDRQRDRFLILDGDELAYRIGYQLLFLGFAVLLKIAGLSHFIFLVIIVVVGGKVFDLNLWAFLNVLKL